MAEGAQARPTRNFHGSEPSQQGASLHHGLGGEAIEASNTQPEWFSRPGYSPGRV